MIRNLTGISIVHSDVALDTHLLVKEGSAQDYFGSPTASGVTAGSA